MLAWRHHFPITVYEKFFQCSRARNTEVNNPIQLELKQPGTLRLSWTPASLAKNLIKNDRKGGDIIFPIISQ